MKVKLNYEELLVLDWISHFPVGSTDLDHLGWLSQNFSVLREDIWRNILALKENREEKAKKLELEIPEEKAEVLMTMVPTTFRWGTGEDAGFNLKVKLAKALWGKRIEISELLGEVGLNSKPKRMRSRRKGGGESHATS